MASQIIAVHIEMPTTLRLSEYLSAVNIGGIAMETTKEINRRENCEKVGAKLGLI